MKKIKLIASILLSVAALSSCDSYLDINTDPNAPSSDLVTASNIMPGAEMALASAYGNYYRIVGGYYSEHFAQQFGTSNYLDYSRFSQSATRSSTAYTQMYQQAIKSYVTIQQKASASEDWGSYLAATTLKAFTYQALVDAYGSVPYSEATDENNSTPKYDDGQDVYDGIVAELDDALSKVSASSTVCTNFLFPNENADAWIKFANALKLKILTRESGAKDVNSQIAALIQENNFPTEDVAWTSCWGTESGSMNPYYSEEFATNWGSNQQNVVANIAITNTMQVTGYTDPRLAAWVNANDDGNIVGGISGTNFSTSKTYKSSYFCRPKETATSPVYLITVPEIDFFIAEYYAKNGNSAQAQSYYNAAIEASFAEAGVDGADQYIARYPYDQSNWQRTIGIAKWIALFGTNDYEAWCEVRRLGYPAFGSVSATDLYDGQDDSSYHPENYVAGTLYTPYQVFGQVGQNKLLQRWPFAESSSSRNSNVPTFQNSDYTNPIFWAAK